MVLQAAGERAPLETQTDSNGAFAFARISAATYTMRIKKDGFRDAVCEKFVVPPRQREQASVTLAGNSEAASVSSSVSIDAGMQFNDEPNYTIAGITDGGESGGHGSDSSQRVSDALVRETLALKSGMNASTAASASGSADVSSTMERERKLRVAIAEAPGSFEANHQLGEFYYQARRFGESIPFLASAYRIDPKESANAYDLARAYEENHDLAHAREQAQKMIAAEDTADAHHLLGDIEEQMHDPMAAVRDYEKAAQLDGRELNYFDWGAELLLHGAVQQAVDVFTKGAKSHPESVRMLAGLGAALYSSGKYGEGAQRVCEAADLRPTDSAPYMFLGRMEKSAPAPLPCAREKLAKFATEHAGDALANYYYGVSLFKCYEQTGDADCAKKSEVSLEKAVAIDPQLAEAYLQLGVLNFSKGEINPAIAAYGNAIKADPRLPEVHFRLGLAYKRAGQAEKAREEFATYEQVKKSEAAEIERERREIGQFVVILKGKDNDKPR